MKTVGQIIKSERLQKNLTLDQLSHLTKIDLKYLQAIEDGKYTDLPSETFAKGFIRNIALRLERDPQELVAIFRRDYRPKDQIQTIQKRPVPLRFSYFNYSQYLPVVVFAIVFLVYLGFQFRAVLTPPRLSITKPELDSVLVSPIEIAGETDVDVKINIGDETVIRPDENGQFDSKLNLPLGETVLSVKATNRFGRTTTRTIPITVISK